MSGKGSGPDRDRIRHLMMAELDGELSADERRELEQVIRDEPELREERDRLQRVKGVTDTMRLKKPPEEVWSDYWVSVYNRIERGVGWILISLGVVVLLVYGAWEFVNALIDDPSVAWWLKAAIFAVVAGGAVLTFSVVREKWFVRRRDPYRGVER